MTVQTVAMGVLGSATTMITRRAARKAMHTSEGAPRLPKAARHRHGFAMFLVLAAAAGVVFAMADVLQEQRKRHGKREGDELERRGNEIRPPYL